MSQKSRQVEKEAKRLHKNWFYRLKDFLQRHTVLSHVVSALFALLVGICGNLMFAKMDESIQKYCLAAIVVFGCAVLIAIISVFCAFLSHSDRRKKTDKKK